MAIGYLRIGEFSQRVGVSAERLRAWEKRYGLLSPQRSPGGFRLYSDEDVAGVERMLEELRRGASAAEAARLALEPAGDQPVSTGDAATPLEAQVRQLRERLERFDDAGAHAALDELLATFALETVLRDAVLPCLAELGARWAAGDISVGQEHFATNLLRGRLMSLAQGWGQGAGPRAVLATPPGEPHELGLLIGGLALARQGLRVVYLGADCPIDTLVTTVQTVRPALVLLAAAAPEPFEAAAASLRALPELAPLYLAGAGALPALARDLGAAGLAEDPVSAAATLARSVAARPPGGGDG